MNVAIVIPTLGRPAALAPLLLNLRQTTSLFYRVYFVVDADDGATRQAIAGLSGSDFCEVVCDGTYPVKTNAGVRAGEEELVLPTADDVVFHSGWLEAAWPRFEAGAAVVGTRDLTPATAKGTHATMPIVRRSYIEHPGAAFGEPGVCFHEGYHHNAVERELWRLAKHRGVAVFEPKSIIEHLHPSWNSREVDDTDRKGNMQNWDADLALYRERERQWLPS